MMSFKKIHILVITFVMLGLWVGLIIGFVGSRWMVGVIASVAHHISVPNDDIVTAFDQSYVIATQGILPESNRFLTPNEQSHLIDVYGYLGPVIDLYWLWFLGLGLMFIYCWLYKIFFLVLDQMFQFISVFILLGLVCVIFFEFFFEVFHQVFFPQGNYSFPANSLLIQAFPLPFWMIMTGLILGLLVVSWIGLFFGKKWFDESPQSSRAV